MRNIVDLMSEIEYYESIGMHRLADKILNKIKLAYQANVSDIGDKGISTLMTVEMLDKILMRIPECQQLFSVDPNARAYITGDWKDCVAVKVQSGMIPADAAVECKKQMSLNSPQMENSTNQQYLSPCLQKAGLGIAETIKPTVAPPPTSV